MRAMICGWLVLALVPAAALAQAPEPAGHIVALQGTATAVGADGTTRALAIKSPIFMQDRIATGAGSRLQIMFTDDSVISQGEKSEMVIDEYVFSSGKKQDNACSVSLAKGLFRVVTDKITKLNPDRFKVKTKMATIGIRGCDLGFSVSPGEEHVYVIMLQGREKVIVDRTLSDAEKQQQEERKHRGLLALLGRLQVVQAEVNTIEVEDSRMMVIIRDGLPMDLVQIPWDLLLKLLEGVQVQPGTAAQPGAGNAPASLDKAVTAAPPGISAAAVSPGGTLQATFLAMMENPTALPPAQPDPAPPKEPVIPTPPTPEPVVPQEPTPEPAPQPQPQPEPVPVFVARGGGTDWSWGVWMLDNVVDSVAFSSPRILTQTDFQTIANGTHLYNLSGSGAAAAVIDHNGTRNLVEGTCSLNVQAGLSVTPNWDGTFTMQNAKSDMLSFEADGTIQSDGKLTGSQVSYQMRVNGVAFDRPTITAERIDGRLVGPGSGAIPVTGAIGSFSFSHGPAAQVNGGFGADVRE